MVGHLLESVQSVLLLGPLEGIKQHCQSCGQYECGIFCVTHYVLCKATDMLIFRPEIKKEVCQRDKAKTERVVAASTEQDSKIRGELGMARNWVSAWQFLCHKIVLCLFKEPARQSNNHILQTYTKKIKRNYLLLCQRRNKENEKLSISRSLNVVFKLEGFMS